MKVEHTKRPLPEGLREHEERLNHELAELQAEYQQRAAPIHAQLLLLEEFRPVPIIMLIPETDEDRAELQRRWSTT